MADERAGAQIPPLEDARAEFLESLPAAYTPPPVTGESVRTAVPELMGATYHVSEVPHKAASGWAQCPAGLGLLKDEHLYREQDGFLYKVFDPVMIIRRDVFAAMQRHIAAQANAWIQHANEPDPGISPEIGQFGEVETPGAIPARRARSRRG